MLTRLEQMSGSTAKKSLGQNFLVDNGIVSKIITSVSPRLGETIVEIGPGKGAITDRLLASGATVIAIELDRLLVPRLREQYSSVKNLTVIEADALSVNYREFLSNDSAPLRLVANLPYYISTAILQRLIEFANVFSDLTLMFQKEVVERIIAQPRNRERGFLTVFVEMYFRAEKLFDVPPSAFLPVPKVTSAVVRLLPRSSPLPDIQVFRSLASRAFAMKRKTLFNNLGRELTDAQAAFERAEVDPTRRAETLDRSEWLALYTSFAEFHDHSQVPGD